MSGISLERSVPSSNFPRKYHHRAKRVPDDVCSPQGRAPRKELNSAGEDAWATAADQNLQQMSPFLQTRRRLLRRRSAFAILTGLLIHSLCNLFIDRRLLIRFRRNFK
jgi:hypothetical protein